MRFATCKIGNFGRVIGMWLAERRRARSRRRSRLLPGLLVALCPPLGLSSAAASVTDDRLTVSERALYQADFGRARSVLDGDAAADARSEDANHLLQRQRIDQVSRLVGLPDASEGATLTRLRGLLETPGLDREMVARIRFGLAASDYFERITSGQVGDLASLRATFAEVSETLRDPCRRADAMFYSALMTQIEGDIAASAPGLQRSAALAAQADCRLELSFSLRHLAVVAEEGGKLDEARRLAAESLDIRRALGFEVYLPFSLLSLADVEEKLGDRQRARAHREEALTIARRLNLPVPMAAAGKSLRGKE